MRYGHSKSLAGSLLVCSAQAKPLNQARSKLPRGQPAPHVPPLCIPRDQPAPLVPPRCSVRLEALTKEKERLSRKLLTAAPHSSGGEVPPKLSSSPEPLRPTDDLAVELADEIAALKVSHAKQVRREKTHDGLTCGCPDPIPHHIPRLIPHLNIHHIIHYTSHHRSRHISQHGSQHRSHHGPHHIILIPHPNIYPIRIP